MDEGPEIVQTPLGPIEVALRGEGPDVLVLHGTMGGYDQSLILAEVLGRPGYRYLAVSRPGYLGTPLDSGKTCEAQADLCAALLDTLGIAEVAVIGPSGGGPTAIELAVRHPTRVWGLVLLSTCATKTRTLAPPATFELMAKLTRWGWLRKRMRASMERNLANAMKPFLSDPEQFSRVLADPELGPLLRDFLLSSLDHMDQIVVGTRNDVETMWTTEHALEMIRVPTLVVHGTADQMVSYEVNAPVFEARIPDVDLLTIDGGEHATLFTHRDQVSEAVTAYLSSRAP